MGDMGDFVTGVSLICVSAFLSLFKYLATVYGEIKMCDIVSAEIIAKAKEGLLMLFPSLDTSFAASSKRGFSRSLFPAMII